MRSIKNFKFNWENYGLFLLIIVLVIIVLIWSPRAFNIRNLSATLRLSAIVGIATIGEGLVLLVRGVDLSVGAVMGLVSISTAIMLNSYSILTTVIILLLICSLIGLINGLFIVKGKIPAIITTLGMMWLLRGIAGSITNGRLIRINEKVFTNLARFSFLGIIPYFFIGLLFLGLIVLFMLNKLSIGRYIYAIGGNEEAAYYSGISVTKVKIIVFVIAAIMYGIAGIFLSSYIRSGMPFAAEGYEFRAITSAALGGIAFSGGKGKLWKGILGAIVLTFLYSFVTSLGISPYLQGIFEGSILIVAVYLCQRD
jgi:ribose transport system permease protein